MRLTLIPPNKHSKFEWEPYLYGDEFDVFSVEHFLFKAIKEKDLNKDQFISFLFQFCLDVATKFNNKLGYEEDTLQMGAVVIHATLLQRSLG
tara:strand:+ start:647 stop:922 length:276 start_codon:yes stop_codon:yes gene_type:complete